MKTKNLRDYSYLTKQAKLKDNFYNLSKGLIYNGTPMAAVTGSLCNTLYRGFNVGKDIAKIAPNTVGPDIGNAIGNVAQAAWGNAPTMKTALTAAGLWAVGHNLGTGMQAVGKFHSKINTPYNKAKAITFTETGKALNKGMDSIMSVLPGGRDYGNSYIREAVTGIRNDVKNVYNKAKTKVTSKLTKKASVRIPISKHAVVLYNIANR